MNLTSKISIEETHCYLMYQINLRHKHQFSIPEFLRLIALKQFLNLAPEFLHLITLTISK